MCTVLLPPGVDPIAVNKYIISYQVYWAAVRMLDVYKAWALPALLQKATYSLN
jgi:hypothetical protein